MTFGQKARQCSLSGLCCVLPELARFASGVIYLLLATVTLDLSNYTYLTFLFVDNWLSNSTSRLPDRLRAEVVEGKHRSKKRRPSFISGCFGSAADIVRICRVSAFVLLCNPFALYLPDYYYEN